VAIQATCPECQKTYTLRDDYAGKTVRCKGCSATFPVTRARRPAAVPAAPDEPEEVADRASAKEREAEDRVPEDDAPARPARSRSAEKDEDADEAPQRTKRRETPTAKVLMIVSGIYLLFALPIATGWYLLIHAATSAASGMVSNADDRQKQQVEEFGKALDQAFGPNAGGDQPPTVDQLLEQLRSGNAGKQTAAANRLAGMPLDAGRQGEVARELDKVLAGSGSEGARVAAMKALKVWADGESVPGIAQVVGDDASASGFGDLRHLGIAILGRLKDQRGAPAVAKSLANAFFNEEASKALQEMGPVAEKAVLGYVNHPDGGARERAKKLLAGYGTQPAALARQSAEDVQANQPDRQRLAADWLAQQPIDESARPEVAAALNKPLASVDNGVRDAAMRAIAVWGTAENVPPLLDLLNASPQATGVTRLAIKVLGKLKDPRAAAALAKRIVNGGERADLEQALVAIGAPAKPEVEKYRDNPDRGVRDEAVKILSMLGGGNVTLEQLVLDLKAGGARAQEACRKLARMPVDSGKQKDVSQALEKALKDTELQTRIEAVRALGVWADKSGVMAVAGLLWDPQRDLRHAALHALGQLKDPRTCDAVAKRWNEPEDRAAARAALEAMGSIAEGSVVGGLNSTSRVVQVETCHILKKIGTRASVPALTAVMNLSLRARHYDVERAARDAIAACSTR
jgi:HEAT repeat protein